MRTTILAAILALVSLNFTQGAFANEGLTRVFEVNWNQPEGYDQDTQMCDDTYYTKAEILVPFSPTIDRAQVKADIEQACSGIEVTVDELQNTKGGMVRFSLDGAWGCSITLEKPLLKGDNAASRYTIDLDESC